MAPSRIFAAFTAAAALLAGSSGPALAVMVHMDQTTVVELKAPVGNVLVANPSIADVSLITPQKLAILGRSYGLTNIIVTDRMGRTIFQQQVNVAAAPTGRVSLYRGVLVNNFACAPHCERTPMPGEEKSASYEPFSQGYKDYSDRAKGESGGGAGGQP
jgi:hypothetical protein